MTTTAADCMDMAQPPRPVWWRGFVAPIEKITPALREWVHPDLIGPGLVGSTVNTGALNIGAATRLAASAQAAGKDGQRIGTLYVAQRPTLGATWAYLPPRPAAALDLLSDGRWVSTETFRRVMRSDGRSPVATLRMAGLIVATRVPDQGEAEWKLIGRAYVGTAAARAAEQCQPLSDFLPPIDQAVMARRLVIEDWRGRKLSAASADFGTWARTKWAKSPTDLPAPTAAPL